MSDRDPMIADPRYGWGHRPVSRRGFLAAAGAGLGAVGWWTNTTRAKSIQRLTCDPSQNERAMDVSNLATIPNYCSHEHWGSIHSIGGAPDGYRADVMPGAIPERMTTLPDLVIDPYFTGCLYAAGVNPSAVVREALDGEEWFQAAAEEPDRVMEVLRPALRDQYAVGTYQCLRRGIQFAYGYDINSDDRKAIREANAEIGCHYSRIFAWYQELMKRARFSGLVRPMHPVFYTQTRNEAAREEMAFTKTVMRIDPLVDLWKPGSAQREPLTEATGIDPRDAKTWRQFLDRLFELAATGGAVGIKQLQAYSRPLDFQPRDDGEVRFADDLTGSEQRVFGDWLVQECCKRAHDRSWPHQVHVGTHNMPDSDPMPLQHLARQYPKQKIIMLHCWPYLEEAGFLAKFTPNMYIDTCWQPVLNPDFFRHAMHLWLGYVPTSKIMMGHDSTSIEMAVGSSLFVREILSESLADVGRRMDLPDDLLQEKAAAMLHGNAVAVYEEGGQLKA